MQIQKVMLNLSLAHVRKVFLFVAFVHLAVTALVTLNIDTTGDDDPVVRAYYYMRWKLITCWFNLITLAYLPVRLYCEWKTSQGDGSSTLVRKLDHATDVVYTSILFPVVVFSDVTFWIVFSRDPSILAPPRIFDFYLPYWAQHSLHTISLVVVLLDLLLTPRQKPNTLKPRVALLLLFSFVYYFVLFDSYSKSEMVYKVLETVNGLQLILMFIFSLIIGLLLFSVQWVVIEFIWGHKPVKKSL